MEIHFTDKGIEISSPYTTTQEKKTIRVIDKKGILPWLLAYATRRYNCMLEDIKKNIFDATLISKDGFVWENGSFSKSEFEALENFISTKKLTPIAFQQIIQEILDRGKTIFIENVGESLYRELQMSSYTPSSVYDEISYLLLCLLDYSAFEDLW